MKIQNNSISELKGVYSYEEISGFQINMDPNLKNGVQNAEKARREMVDAFPGCSQFSTLIYDVFTTTGWSIAGKTLGFIVPFFIAAWFGVSGKTDAFFFAYGIILFLCGVFAPVIENVMVPYVAEKRVQKKHVGEFISKVAGLCALGAIGILIILFLIIKPVLYLLTQFPKSSINLIYWLLLETAPIVILTIWTGILAGTLNAYKKFSFPAIAPAFRAIANLGFIYIFKDRLGIHSIALGYVFGEVVRLVILLIVIKHLNILKLSFSLYPDPYFWDFVRTFSYQAAGMLIIGLNAFIDKIMASYLGEGKISVLHYANRLYAIPVTFMTAGLMVTLLSHWSEKYYKTGFESLKAEVKTVVKIVGFITLGITLFLILFCQPIVNIAYGRGEFTKKELTEVSKIWICYLVGFSVYIISQVFVRAHLTLKNTKILMKCGVYLVILKISINYILMQKFNLAGIALANSFIYLFSILYLGGLFYGRIQPD